MLREELGDLDSDDLGPISQISVLSVLSLKKVLLHPGL